MSRSGSILYVFLQRIIKLATALFFQKIELRHGENVPRSGPVVFVANHPDSTMDAFVLSTMTKRKVHYLGHAGLFANKLKAWMLRSCGVIPVYRRPREAGTKDQNIEAFRECYDLLEKGGTIGIFPEGISDMKRQIKKAKTGAARIVLEAEKRNNYRLGIKLIPVGLHFFSLSRFRSKVLINIGRPLDLQPFYALDEADNFIAVNELTSQIQLSLEQLTVNIRHIELDRLIRDIEKIYRDELVSDIPDIRKSSKQTVAEFVITQRIAECVEYYYEHEPEKVRDMEERITAYRRKLKRLHLKDGMLREKTSIKKLYRAELVGILKAIFGFPLAAYGIVNNFIPYRISESIAKKFMDERTKILTALFLGGGTTFLLFYAAQVMLVWFKGGLLWAILYFFSLPSSGFFALAYLRNLRELQERISFSFFLFTNRHLIGKMRRARNALISEMNAYKEEYLNRCGDLDSKKRIG